MEDNESSRDFLLLLWGQKRVFEPRPGTRRFERAFGGARDAAASIHPTCSRCRDRSLDRLLYMTHLAHPPSPPATRIGTTSAANGNAAATAKQIFYTLECRPAARHRTDSMPSIDSQSPNSLREPPINLKHYRMPLDNNRTVSGYVFISSSATS